MGIQRHITTPAKGFAQAVSTTGPGRLIHVSGALGTGPDGLVVPGGMDAEASAAFDRIEETLEEIGATISDVVKINAFLTSLAAYPDYAAARQERFGEEMPASATVQVAGLLGGAQVEIDALAFVSEDDQ
jgi:enamine deaminase RidA (YjgF/YER057c/UK114 family)